MNVLALWTVLFRGRSTFSHMDSAVLTKWIFIKLKNLFPPGLEPGTFRVLGERDNHYTTETLCISGQVPFIS